MLKYSNEIYFSVRLGRFSLNIQCLNLKPYSVITEFFMIENISKPVISKLFILAIYQIFGGIIGIVLTIYIASTVATFPFIVIAMLLVALALYYYSILCGVLILKNPFIGLKRSLVLQFLQVVFFSISGFGFKYFSGLYFTVEFDLGYFPNFELGWGISSWNFNFKNASHKNYVGVNFLAILLVIFIDKQISKLKEKTLQNKILELGQN